MKPKRRKVPIPTGLAADIDKLVGKRNRSAFATETVEREIGKLKQRRAQREADGDRMGRDHSHA